MRALIASVTARCAAMVVAVLLTGVAGYAWWTGREAALAERERQVQLVTAVLALSTADDALRAAVARASPSGRVSVHLPDGRRVGPSRAGAEQVAAALRDGRARTVGTADGRSALYPAGTPDGTPGGTALVEVALPARTAAIPGVLGAVLAFAAAGLGAVGLAMLAADRWTAPVVRQLRELGQAGTGRPATTPPAVGRHRALAAIRSMVEQVDGMARQLVAREHKMIADVSHRLRTPLTALRLDAEAVTAGPVAERIRSAVISLEHDVDDIIRAAGQALEPIEPSDTTCDLNDVVRQRMRFWQVMTDTQQRPCEVGCLDEAAPVGLAEDDVAAIVDILVSNVIRHTLPGTPLAITVGRHDGWVTLVVDDGGPGIADPEAALRRGISGDGSTGLGLDIARAGVEATGGTIHLERGKLGGARVRLRFAEAGLDRGQRQPRAWRLWAGRPRRMG